MTLVGDDTSHDIALSVIIPVLNGARDLPRQLEALADQRFYRHWEVIVADNGSTDETIATALCFQGRLPCIRVVNASARAGQSYARNAAARQARGKFLLFLDADDVVTPGYLMAMASALDEHPFVTSRLDCESLNPRWLWSSRPPTQVDGVGTSFSFLPSTAVGCTGIWKTTFDSVGGFDLEVVPGEDVDLSWRVQLSQGCEPRFVPNATVMYQYRQTFRGIFAQGRGYGSAGPKLYRRYRDRGMPRRPWQVALRYHGAVLWRLARSRSKSDLAACVFLFGFRVGLLEGSIQERVIYL